jgi:hypothetical protein
LKNLHIFAIERKVEGGSERRRERERKREREKCSI